MRSPTPVAQHKQMATATRRPSGLPLLAPPKGAVRRLLGRPLADMYIMMYIRDMSKRYSIAEARSNFAAIVDQAEAGQEIELTRRGKSVAVVVSLRDLERLRSERPLFGEAYKRFLKAHPLREVGLEEDFFDSTRDRGSGRKVTL